MNLRICVSILPKNKVEAIELIEKAKKSRADFIEVRLDHLEDTNLEEIAKSTNIPLIATCKLKSEKGFFYGNESQRQPILLKAAEVGFEYVDVDFLSEKRNETIIKLRAIGAKPIVSYHNYDSILPISKVERQLVEQITLGASVCKIVLTAKQLEDNLPVLSFVSFASAKANLVCFCMGEYGRISRLLSPLFGAFFTFASLEKDSQTAEGQMTISEMKAAYNLLGITK